jgi:hypothetical protein
MPTWRNGGWLQEAWVNRVSKRGSDRDPRAALRKCVMMSHLPMEVQLALDAAKLAHPPAPRGESPRREPPRAPLAAFPDRREVEGRAAFERAAAQLFDNRRDALRSTPRAQLAQAQLAQAAAPGVESPFSPALIAALLVLFPPAGVFAVWTTDRLPLQGKTAASVVAGLWVVLLAALFFAR